MDTIANVAYTIAFALTATGFDLFFLSPPEVLRMTATENCLLVSDIRAQTVPLGATAIVASIHLFSNAHSDFVVHSFGRSNNHTCSVWDNTVYEADSYLNDVLLTSEGGCCCGYCSTSFYGNAHGTIIIPLLPDGSFQAALAMGYGEGTHYITIQVYGYFTGPFILPQQSVYNLRTNTSAIDQTVDLDALVPAGATAVLGGLSSFISDQNDFFATSLGRFGNHSAQVWGMEAYDTNETLNDQLIFHEGGVDGPMTYHFGHSHGSVLVPLSPDGSYSMMTNIGKRAPEPDAVADSFAYLTNQIFGYLPGEQYTNVRFFPHDEIQKIRFSFQQTEYTLTDNAVPGLPVDAVAILCNVFTYNVPDNNDHMTHTFGRNPAHNAYFGLVYDSVS